MGHQKQLELHHMTPIDCQDHFHLVVSTRSLPTLVKCDKIDLYVLYSVIFEKIWNELTDNCLIFLCPPFLLLS